MLNELALKVDSETGIVAQILKGIQNICAPRTDRFQLFWGGAGGA